MAKRDTIKPAHVIDDETGERVYRGLDMPGFDDEEDDGTRELSYEQLIEPKLVEAAPISAVGQVSDSKGSDTLSGGQTMDSQGEVSQLAGSTVQETMVVDVARDIADIGETSPSRGQDLSDLIHEAGFDSGLLSGIALPAAVKSSPKPATPRSERADRHENIPREAPNPSQTSGEDNLTFHGSDVSSPRFNGFGSSSPARHIPSETSGDQHDVESPNKHASSTTKGTSPVQEIVAYPKLPQNLNLDDDEPAFTAFDDDLEFDGFGDNDDEGPPGSQELPGRPRQDKDVDEEAADELAAPESLKSTISATQDAATQDSIRPSDDISQASSRVPNPFYTGIDGSGDDSDLPSFEQLKSSARSARELSARSVRSARVSPPTVKSKSKPRASQRLKSSSPMFTPSSPHQVADDFGTQKVSMSQAPEGSQVVDLTFSSSPVSPSNSDGDFNPSRGLPKGPGWVKKTTRASTGSSSQPQKLVRRTRKTG